MTRVDAPPPGYAVQGCGYNVSKDVVFVPISALTASNVVKRYEDATWYTGPCFLEVLDSLPACERNQSSALRLPILSKYKDMGTVVEGKVEQGTITVGDKLFVMPNRVPVEVKSTGRARSGTGRSRVNDNSTHWGQMNSSCSPRPSLLSPPTRVGSPCVRVSQVTNVWLDQDEVAYLVGGENARVKLKVRPHLPWCAQKEAL